MTGVYFVIAWSSSNINICLFVISVGLTIKYDTYSQELNKWRWTSSPVWDGKFHTPTIHLQTSKQNNDYIPLRVSFIARHPIVVSWKWYVMHKNVGFKLSSDQCSLDLAIPASLFKLINYSQTPLFLRIPGECYLLSAK